MGALLAGAARPAAPRPFNLRLDPGQRLARRLEATSTSEAVVLAAQERTVLYRNWLEASGLSCTGKLLVQ